MSTYDTDNMMVITYNCDWQTTQILERHLVVADKAYTMSQLKAMTHNGTISLSTVRDTLVLRVRESDGSEYKSAKFIHRF